MTHQHNAFGSSKVCLFNRYFLITGFFISKWKWSALLRANSTEMSIILTKWLRRVVGLWHQHAWGCQFQEQNNLTFYKVFYVLCLRLRESWWNNLLSSNKPQGKRFVVMEIASHMTTNCNRCLEVSQSHLISEVMLHGKSR